MALLIYAGIQVEDIHDSLPSPTRPSSVSNEQWMEYRQSKEKLNQYFLPQKPNDFALFELMRVKPEEGERTGNYAARLRKAAEKCDFANWTADKMIKCLIISNLHDNQLRLICLQKELTLYKLLEKARKREDAMAMNEVMHKKDGEKEKLNRVKQRYPFKGPHQRKEETQGKCESKGRDEEQCLRCGSRRHKTTAECPALGKKCDFCNKTGHFAKVCFKKLVNSIKEKPTQSDTDEIDYDEQVAKVAERDPVHLTSNTNVEYGQATTDDQIFNVGTRQALVRAKMDGLELTWQPDTGATRDIMDERHLREYEKEVGRKVTLSPSPVKLFAYGSNRSLELARGVSPVRTYHRITQNNDLLRTRRIVSL
jgi:hypothetical protein